MSILGYSSAYFLPQYWANTPLYGEKIIPLLDYVLSTDYQYTDRLASAFYDIESKYKNTADLPIDKIEAIIEESGYTYIRDLLAQDEESLRLFVYILVLVNELKGSKKGVETVLNLLKTREDDMELHLVGNIAPSESRDVSGFTATDYITFSNFNVGTNPFELFFKFKTGEAFDVEQCIASSPERGFYLGIGPDGNLVLKVGMVVNGTRVWQTLGGSSTATSAKILQRNTDYYLKFYFTGSSYGVSVSTDNSTYQNYIDAASSTGLSITGGTLILGVDGSGADTRYPFQGTISLTSINASASSVKITQWYETFPVGEEDTFDIDASVDVNLVSADFFVKFAKFIERYVYPSLRVLRTRMALKAKITFLPYVRQKMNYIASNIMGTVEGYEPYTVKEESNPEEHEVFSVRTPKLYAWTYNNEYVYTHSQKIYAATKLYNKDNTAYTGSKFIVANKSGNGIIEYEVRYGENPTTLDERAHIYGGVPFLTIEGDD